MPRDSIVRVSDRLYDHKRHDRIISRIRDHELKRRGIIRLTELDFRAATDDELDRFWGRGAAEPDDPVDDVELPVRGLLRTLALEFIGHDYAKKLRVPKMRPWVAQLTFDATGKIIDRTFAEPVGTDLTESDETGCRGVYMHFLLPQGVPLEVFDRARPLGPRRVFMFHDGNGWRDITRECAIRCALVHGNHQPRDRGRLDMHSCTDHVAFLSPTVTVTVREDGQITSTHATPRAAEIYAAAETLRSQGWRIREPASGEDYRRPLLLPGETIYKPLCGSLCDERAQGFTAARDGATLRVDASAGLPLLYLVDEGDTASARVIVESFLC